MISSNDMFIASTDGTFTITDSGRRLLDRDIETSNKMQQLIKDQVIGGDSWRLGTASAGRKFEFYQGSENYNDQWHHLNNAGPDGKQAAEYLTQMITEKRQKVDQYLKDYDALASELSSIVKIENLQDIDIESVLDNVKAGRAGADNGDGSTLPEAALINQFQNDFEQEINDLNQQLDELYQLPKHLSNWLDQNNIDRPIAVDKLAEKYQYIDHNGKSQGATALDAVSDSLGTYKTSHRLDDDGTMASIIGLMGDSKYAVRQPAEALMREDQRAFYQTYIQASQPVADTFNEQLATELTPRFTFQDLVDNLKAGRDPAAVYVDGSYQTHPQAERISEFYKGRSFDLQKIATMQQKLEQRVTMQEWLQDPNNADRAYQKMAEVYGIERWETGELSRMERGWRKFSQDSFMPNGTYHIKDEVLSANEWKARIKNEAYELEADLKKLLSSSMGMSAEPFSLEQLIDNFRQGKPLGLMENGKPHPYADQIQFAFSTEKFKIADFIDSQWLRDGLTPPQLSAEEKKEELVDNVMTMIRESREVWTFDKLLGIDDQEKEQDSSEEAVAEINKILKQAQMS